MKIRYHDEAAWEIEDAFEWYEAQQKGLGSKLAEETETAIFRIMSFPFLHVEIHEDIRRAILPVFPYAIIYSVVNDEIQVHAFSHLHREPLYWKGRIRSK